MRLTCAIQLLAERVQDAAVCSLLDGCVRLP